MAGTVNYGPVMDAETEELRAAHDVLAELYAARLADALDRMPAERAVLGLFCDLTLAADLGTSVGDIGCGTGRLEPYLAAKGLSPRGIDLSPEMIRVARRDYPGFEFDVADLRDLPFEDASLAGAVCWYSLMYLAPSARPAAFSELARVVKPGGYLVTAFAPTTTLTRGTAWSLRRFFRRSPRRLRPGTSARVAQMTQAGPSSVLCFEQQPTVRRATPRPRKRAARPGESEALRAGLDRANARSCRLRVLISSMLGDSIGCAAPVAPAPGPSAVRAVCRHGRAGPARQRDNPACWSGSRSCRPGSSGSRPEAALARDRRDP